MRIVHALHDTELARMEFPETDAQTMGKGYLQDMFCPHGNGKFQGVVFLARDLSWNPGCRKKAPTSPIVKPQRSMFTSQAM